MTDLTLDIGDQGVKKVTQTPEANSMAFSLDNTVPSSSLSIKRVADTSLVKYRVVKQVGGNRAGYPNIETSMDANLILGVTIENVSANRETVIRMVGEIEDPSWNWVVGPVYCGAQGMITQTLPSGIWQRQIGSAISPTKLLIELRPPGATARTILSGYGDPPALVGSNGDFFLDLLNARIYGPKQENAWPEIFTTLTGPMGPQGMAGPMGPAAPLRMNVFVGDRPGPAEYVFRYIVQDSMILQPQACKASSEIAADDFCTFMVLKNGQHIGDIIFPAGSKQAIVAIEDEVLVADDILTIRAPADVDSNLAHISFLLSWSILS